MCSANMGKDQTQREFLLRGSWTRTPRVRKEETKGQGLDRVPRQPPFRVTCNIRHDIS